MFEPFLIFCHSLNRGWQKKKDYYKTRELLVKCEWNRLKYLVLHNFSRGVMLRQQYYLCKQEAAPFMWSEHNITSQLCNEAPSHPTNGFQLVVTLCTQRSQNNNVCMTPTQMCESRKHSGLRAKEVRNHLKVNITKNKGLIVELWKCFKNGRCSKQTLDPNTRSTRQQQKNYECKFWLKPWSMRRSDPADWTPNQIDSSLCPSEIISESY